MFRVLGAYVPHELFELDYTCNIKEDQVEFVTYSGITNLSIHLQMFTDVNGAHLIMHLCTTAILISSLLLPTVFHPKI